MNIKDLSVSNEFKLNLKGEILITVNSVLSAINGADIDSYDYIKAIFSFSPITKNISLTEFHEDIFEGFISEEQKENFVEFCLKYFKNSSFFEKLLSINVDDIIFQLRNCDINNYKFDYYSFDHSSSKKIFFKNEEDMVTFHFEDLTLKNLYFRLEGYHFLNFKYYFSKEEQDDFYNKFSQHKQFRLKKLLH